MVLLRNLLINLGKLVFFIRIIVQAKNCVKVVRYWMVFNGESNVVINDLTQMLPLLTKKKIEDIINIMQKKWLIPRNWGMKWNVILQDKL